MPDSGQGLGYADGIPCRDPAKKGCPTYDTKLHLMRLMFWRFGEFRVPLCFHYCQVHSDPVVVHVRVPSLGQIEMLDTT